jgi:predicted nucleotidyltransferase
MTRASDDAERSDEEERRTLTVAARTAEAVDAVRRQGAVFAYLHGSRVTGIAREVSDIDIAAHFGGRRPPAFEILLPPSVDLLVLDDAPLEIAGRVALRGLLLFETDRQARVVWEATTRKIYLDELPRISRAHREFARAVHRDR